MIQFTRTSAIAPGKLADAIGFAREIAEFLEKNYDRKLQVAVPVGGNPHRVSWRGTYRSLAEMEEFQGKTLRDPQYLAILAKSGSLFIAGSVVDEIWRDVE